MTAVEIEVKFRVQNLPRLEELLLVHGFGQLTPRTFEHNTLFDTPERALRGQHSILRVRRYGDRWVITHKAVLGGGTSDEHYKHRAETETEVADGEAMASIFTQLGYSPSFVYEKWRTEYADATGHCVIDETPIGLFAELEGPESWIDAVAKQLGLAEKDLMTASYGRLFDDWCKQTGSTAQNLTFAEIGPNSTTPE